MSVEMSPYLPERREPFIERIGKLAKDLTSGVAGVGATAATANPLLGVAAAAAADEAGKRVLAAVGHRPQDRAEATMNQAARRVKERREGGEEPRDDDFCADSEEALGLIETALRASMNSTELSKALLIGNLISAANFDKTLSLADVLRNLRLVEALSWRQILTLGWVEDTSYRELRELLAAEGEEGSRQLRPGFEAELSELARSQELVGTHQEDGTVTNPANTWGTGQLTAASVARLALTGAGATLYRLTELDAVISNDDLEQFVSEEIEVDV